MLGALYDRMVVLRVVIVGTGAHYSANLNRHGPGQSLSYVMENPGFLPSLRI